MMFGFLLLILVPLLFTAASEYSDYEDAQDAIAARVDLEDIDEDIRLSQGDDLYDGRGGDDRIAALGGDDGVDGGTGDDTLFGGAGDDVLYGAQGSDLVYGKEGDDLIIGGDESDRIDGGSDNDLLFGSKSDDRLEGGAGNDTLSGDLARDLVQGDDGDDLLVGGALVSYDIDYNQILRTPEEALTQGLSIQDDGRADTLAGGSGDDTLLLGSFDRGEGAEGADRFMVLDRSLASNALLAEVTDLAPDEGDSLVVLYDPNVDTAPELSLSDDPNRDGARLLLSDGVAIARLLGDGVGSLTPATITALPADPRLLST